MNLSEVFKDKVVWITGASAGIGEGMVKAFSGYGAKVILSSRNQVELERVASECVTNGANESDVMVLPLDVVAYEAMPNALQAILERYSRIDFLINNAGLGARDKLLEIDMDVFRKVMEVNLFASVALSKAVLPEMMRQGSGRIVGVSSLAGKIGIHLRTAYCPAKHAICGFFDALRAEVAHYGIKVTTIVPGVVRTAAAANSLNGRGVPHGPENGVMLGGLSVDEAIAIIMRGFAEDTDEILVAQESEMDLMKMKGNDPVAVFRAIEESAEREVYGGG